MAYQLIACGVTYKHKLVEGEFPTCVLFLIARILSCNTKGSRVIHFVCVITQKKYMSLLLFEVYSVACDMLKQNAKEHAHYRRYTDLLASDIANDIFSN